jgi:hypothetical protein
MGGVGGMALARRWAVRIEVDVAGVLEAAARHVWVCLVGCLQGDRNVQRRDRHQRVVLVLALYRPGDAEDDVLVVVWYYRVDP